LPRFSIDIFPKMLLVSQYPRWAVPQRRPTGAKFGNAGAGTDR